MSSSQRIGTLIHRTLEGDGLIVETPHGPVEFYISKINEFEIKVAVRAPIDMPITAVHMNPNRKLLRRP